MTPTPGPGRNGSILDVTKLETVYSSIIPVLRKVTLRVPDRGVVALLGANGAGKTTFLRAVSGILGMQNGRVEGGSLRFAGEELSGMGPSEIVRAGISMVPEGRRIFPELTVHENLMIGAHTRADNRGIREDEERVLDYFPVLRQRKGQPAGYLSGGEQQMLAIGRAFMSKPTLMMLDEPSLGLAPLVVRNIFEILGKINREEGTAILLVEQNARTALKFADFGYILEGGRVVLEGPSGKLADNPDVKEFYLGISGTKQRTDYSKVKQYRRRKAWAV